MGTRLIIGCGYLGRRLAARWQEQGHTVFATTRSGPRAEEWTRLGWRPVVCDVLDPATLQSLPAADAIVCAVGMDRSAGIPMRRVYVEGIRHLAERFSAPEFARSRILYVSSTSVYGQTDGSIVDETTVPDPLEESGQIVLEAEQTLRERLPASILARFAGIYGPDRLLRGEAIRKGEPITGLPEKWLNLIHVLDGAAAVDCLLERAGQGTTFTVADGAPVRRRDFYACLAACLQAPEPRWLPPPEPLPVGERVDRQVAAPGLRALGWHPVYADYRQGLAQATSRPAAT